MLSFVNDYCEAAHENILKRIEETALIKQPGYGSDEICRSAKEKIREACMCPEAEIVFLVGGTQTNQTVIDTMTTAYQGVIAAETGHVNVHEAGAIEYSGHKVLTLPAHEGKIKSDQLEKYIETFYKDGNHEHMVYPGMVYISQPTEYGTLYSKAELTEISGICRNYEIPLFIDGARLGYALAAKENDVTLPEIAELSDVFYIGGTKVGAMFGEAVVFTKHNMPKCMTAQVKQHGALLAKGWLLGIQFDELFTDDLYLKISQNAIETANVLKQALKEKGYTFQLDSPTNQIFVILENSQMEELAKKVHFSFMETIDDSHTSVRFCTSWATKMEDVRALIDIL